MCRTLTFRSEDGRVVETLTLVEGEESRGFSERFRGRFFVCVVFVEVRFYVRLSFWLFLVVFCLIFFVVLRILRSRYDRISVFIF